MDIAILLSALIASWAVIFVVLIRPKLAVFRQTTGIDAALASAEASFWVRTKLWLKGLKVMIAGVITSVIPLAPALYDKVSGVDWTQFFPTERAKTIAMVVTVLGVAGPMLMVVFHQAGLADAAATEPQR